MITECSGWGWRRDIHYHEQFKEWLGKQTLRGKGLQYRPHTFQVRTAEIKGAECQQRLKPFSNNPSKSMLLYCHPFISLCRLAELNGHCLLGWNANNSYIYKERKTKPELINDSIIKEKNPGFVTRVIFTWYMHRQKWRMRFCDVKW